MKPRLDRDFVVNNWPKNLLSKPQRINQKNGNRKFSKRRKGEENWLISGLSFVPHTISGVNVCCFSTSECRKHCISQTGYGKLKKVQLAREIKTAAFHYDSLVFINQLHGEISKYREYANKINMKLAIRLNVFSDIEWEYWGSLFKNHSDVQFYDYTKDAGRMISPQIPFNYDLTYSRSENREGTAQSILELGKRVAVIFPHDKPLPDSYLGYQVVDGDESDLRFLDPKNCVVGLRAKGSLKNDDFSKFKV